MKNSTLLTIASANIIIYMFQTTQTTPVHIAPVFIYSYITKSKFYMVLAFLESTRRQETFVLYSSYIAKGEGGGMVVDLICFM